MDSNKKDYKFIFWVHLIITLIFIFSWIFFRWEIIFIGGIILQLQYWIFNGCLLSQAEFKSEEACIPYYLYKWNLIKNKNKNKTKIFFRYFMPLIIILLSLIWQLLLKINPLIY